LSGTASNPVQAHTGHVHSTKVMKMLVEGRTAGDGHAALPEAGRKSS
jgi:hypothetical protein